MILPTKHLYENRALLTSGSELLELLSVPRTMNNLWNAVKCSRSEGNPILPYDWFVLSLDFLYSIGAIDMSDGVLRRARS
jgi:hypothetical protein